MSKMNTGKIIALAAVIIALFSLIVYVLHPILYLSSTSSDSSTSPPTLPPVAVEITEPNDGVTVSDNPVMVTGTVKNITNEDLSLWVCVKSYDGIWYPQETLTMIGEETWEADTKPGFSTNSADIGKKFGIVVLVVTKEADEELRKLLRGEGDIADGWGLKALPKGVKILDQITVIRGREE